MEVLKFSGEPYPTVPHSRYAAWATAPRSLLSLRSPSPVGELSTSSFGRIREFPCPSTQTMQSAGCGNCCASGQWMGWRHLECCRYLVLRTVANRGWDWSTRLLPPHPASTTQLRNLEISSRMISNGKCALHLLELRDAARRPLAALIAPLLTHNCCCATRQFFGSWARRMASIQIATRPMAAASRLWSGFLSLRGFSGKGYASPSKRQPAAGDAPCAARECCAARCCMRLPFNALIILCLGKRKFFNSKHHGFLVLFFAVLKQALSCGQTHTRTDSLGGAFCLCCCR